jgi:rod shape-determining protein MreC
MKKFFQNKKIITIFVIVVLILSLLTVSVHARQLRSGPLFVQKVGNETMAIGSRLLNWPLALISGGANSVHDIMQAESENDHLKKQVDSLAQTKARNASLESENAQLKKALKLKSSLTDYHLINGSVISRSPETWSDILIIDRGSSSGVRKNMAVMSGGGVIGRIIEVDQTTAKVELLTTSDKQANRFAVQAKSSSVKMVHGVISATNGQLSFTQVNNGHKLKTGTKVYTSGMGGNSPQGLLIGKVSKTTKDSYGLSDVITIKPAGELTSPSVVTVVQRKEAD